MNLDKIDHEYDPDDKVVVYLREVTRRLGGFVGTRPAAATLVALLELMTARTIRYTDGFVINERQDLSRALGYAEVDLIGSALYDEPEFDASYVRRLRLAHDFDDAEFDNETRRLLDAMQADPRVEGIV